ncbi:hypothetical protein [Bacteroides caccae]|uniref:hypothetical protein n=1 Tax=Bacteroides caccae TaxID=47678 RepID=UPI003565EAB9
MPNRSDNQSGGQPLQRWCGRPADQPTKRITFCSGNLFIGRLFPWLIIRQAIQSNNIMYGRTSILLANQTDNTSVGRLFSQPFHVRSRPLEPLRSQTMNSPSFSFFICGVDSKVSFVNKLHHGKRNTLYRLFHAKRRSGKNNADRAGGKLPALCERDECSGGGLRLPATQHCRDEKT